MMTTNGYKILKLMLGETAKSDWSTSGLNGDFFENFGLVGHQ